MSDYKQVQEMLGLDNKDETAKDVEPTVESTKKVEPIESSKENVDDTPKISIDDLSKSLEDTKRWGHEARQTYSLAKKRINDIASKWIENDIIYEEDKEELLNIFSKEIESQDDSDSDQDVVDENEIYKNAISKLDEELPKYISYTKDKDAKVNLEGFYASMSFLPKNKIKDIAEYINSADSTDALEYVNIMGKEFNSTLGAGIKKHGDIFKYVNKLSGENKKLQDDIKELNKKLDSTYGNIENSSIKSRASYSSDNSNDSKHSIVKSLFA